MGHHSKIIIGFVSAIAAAVGVVMIFGHGYRGSPPDWHFWLSRGLVTVGAVGLVVVIATMLRRDRAPDFLRQLTRNPLECKGLCFLPRIEERGGLLFLAIFFQNRYDRPCIPTIQFTHSDVRFNETPLHLQPVEFAVDAAEFGVFRRAIRVPDHLRGREVTLSITGRNHFPEGCGRMVRFRDGATVGGWDQKKLNLLMIVAAAFGHIHIAQTANIKLAVPAESQSSDANDCPDEVESIWNLQHSEQT